MDASVKPGDDFFGYVNGAWYHRTAIAPDRTFVGIDSVLNDTTERNAWYEAFNVQPSDKLYLPPDQRVRIW